MFTKLNNEAIFNAYIEAVKLNLGVDFISILKDELDRRGITAELQNLDEPTK